MKKLKEVLEGTVIPFHRPPPKQNPDILTHEKVLDSMHSIVNANSSKWNHPELSPRGGMDHSLEYIDHHVSTDPRALYKDNVAGIQSFNRRKSIAKSHYLNNKKDIDGHLNSTVLSLDQLHAKVDATKFPSEIERLKSRRDIGIAYAHWNRIRDNLNSVGS